MADVRRSGQYPEYAAFVLCVSHTMRDTQPRDPVQGSIQEPLGARYARRQFVKSWIPALVSLNNMHFIKA